MKKIIKYSIYIFILSLFFVGFTYAQSTTNTNTSASIPNPFSGGNTLNELIVTILNKVVMPIAAVASIFYIIWAGFKYVLARGNPAKITEANKNLLYALIGVGVLLGAAGISEVVQNTVKSITN